MFKRALFQAVTAKPANSIQCARYMLGTGVFIEAKKVEVFFQMSKTQPDPMQSFHFLISYQLAWL